MPENKGWECPRCHRCYAPDVKECPHCPAEVIAKPVINPPLVPYVPYWPPVGTGYPPWPPDYIVTC
jgi:hypothetical protein